MRGERKREREREEVVRNGVVLSSSTLLLATAPPSPREYVSFFVCAPVPRAREGGAARPTPGIQRGVSRLQRGILYYDDQ